MGWWPFGGTAPQKPAEQEEHDAYASGRRPVPEFTPEAEAKALRDAEEEQIRIAMKYSQPLQPFVPETEEEERILQQFDRFMLRWTVGGAATGAASAGFVTHVWLPRSFLKEVWETTPRWPKLLAVAGVAVIGGGLGLQYSFATGIQRLASMPDGNLSRYYRDVAERWKRKSNPPKLSAVHVAGGPAH
eukprot:EG_transcript_21243